MGAVVKHLFSSLNAVSASVFHSQFFPASFFVSSVSGHVTLE